MSFDVFLGPSTTAPSASEFRARLAETLRAAGAIGPRSSFDGYVQLADGSAFEIFGCSDDSDGAGAMFALRGLTVEIARAIFAVADATSCFIYWSSQSIYRTPNTGQLPKPTRPDPSGWPEVLLSDSTGLLRALEDEFGGWAQFAADVSTALNSPETR